MHARRQCAGCARWFPRLRQHDFPLFNGTARDMPGETLCMAAPSPSAAADATRRYAQIASMRERRRRPRQLRACLINITASQTRHAGFEQRISTCDKTTVLASFALMPPHFFEARRAISSRAATSGLMLLEEMRYRQLIFHFHALSPDYLPLFLLIHNTHTMTTFSARATEMLRAYRWRFSGALVAYEFIIQPAGCITRKECHIT